MEDQTEEYIVLLTTLCTLTEMQNAEFLAIRVSAIIQTEIVAIFICLSKKKSSKEPFLEGSTGGSVLKNRSNDSHGEKNNPFLLFFLLLLLIFE